MKIQQATDQFLAGVPILCAEYRSSVAEVIRWRDKETKQPLTASILRHNVESADGKPAVVNERVDEKFDTVSYKSPFKKGQKVVVIYTALEVNRGMPSFQGKLEELAG